MKIPKPLKGIARKFRNKKGSQIADTTADIEKSRSSDVPEDVEKVKDILDVEGQEEAINVDKATETDTKLYEDINQDSEDLNIHQPICEISEKAQNASTEQKPNASESPPLAELCSGSGKENPANEKSSTQPIVAGIVGVLLLASGVALYIMKMPIVAVVVGIVGLVCMSFALYYVLKPNTKFEKVEQPAFFESNIRK